MSLPFPNESRSFRLLGSLLERQIGLGQQEKCDAVRDAISISHPHIVCLQESKLHEPDAYKCKSFLPTYLSDFAFVPANGSRGGIVTSWNPNAVLAGPTILNDYSLSTPFISTTSSYSFTVSNIYAPSNHRDTDLFLNELGSSAPPGDTSWLLIGDFNLTRSLEDKNNPNFNWRLADKFNSLIDGLALAELPLLDHRFTWSNKRSSPTLATLDRAFMNNDFACRFPNSSLSSRLGSTSDHIPLILHIPTSIPKSHGFRFENAWLKSRSYLPSVVPA